MDAGIATSGAMGSDCQYFPSQTEHDGKAIRARTVDKDQSKFCRDVARG